MNDCKKCRTLFLEAYYEDIDAQKKQFFLDHLQVCKKCRTEFEDMESTLQFTKKRVRPEPPKEFWDSYEERLARRLEKDEALQIERESRRKRLLPAIDLVPKWAYQAAAALVLIVVGLVLGRMIFSPSGPGIQQASQQPGPIIQQRPGTDFIHRSQDYLERSKLILLALVNFDAATEDPYALDLPFQKQVSRGLLQEASSLKQELSASKEKRLESLIASLEIILLQIANLESENDYEAIELIKEGIDRRGILMEINLTDLRRSIKKGEAAVSPQQPSNKTKI